MKVPLLDLRAGYQAIKEEVEAAVLETMEAQAFILGKRVQDFEAAIADYVGVEHAVGCASGSDALLLALMALEVGPGDEVITTPYTFFATAGAIARLRARPVFVDIDPETYNLDPNHLEAAITSATKAVIPVHLFGQCADMGAIMEICERRGVPVVEDAAQALGARWQGTSAGAFGVCGCFSFYPSKNLGGFGDGGMVTTNDGEVARKLRALRTHGGTRKYYYEYVGMNSRLDAIQAVVLQVKLKRLQAYHEGRRRNADVYRVLFREAGLEGVVTLPRERAEAYHVYNQFVIRVPERDALKAYLKEAGVGTEIYYPLSLHKQPCFVELGYRPGDFPESEAAEKTALAIPVYPELTRDQLAWVVSSVRAFYERPERAGKRPAQV